MEKQCPTYEEFVEFYNYFPHGNPKDGWHACCYAIKHRTLPSGGDITFDLIKDKWRTYFTTSREAGQKLQYVKKINKFIDDEDYLGQYQMPDNYISFLKELYQL